MPLFYNDSDIRRLLNFVVCNKDDRWSKNVVERLLKKLPKNTRALAVAQLENALQRKELDSPCVTIDNSQDGRIQVNHQKKPPHVFACKLFRWPDVEHYHEVKSIDRCSYPYDNRRGQAVCINPYHYEVIKHQVSSNHASFFQSNSSFDRLPSSCSSGSESECCPQSSIPVLATDRATSFTGRAYRGSPYSSQQCSPYSTYTVSSSPARLFTMSPSKDRIDRKQSTEFPYAVQFPPKIDESKIWSTIMYFELNSQVGDSFKATTPIVTIDGFTDPSVDNSRLSLGALPNASRNSTVEKVRKSIGKGVQFELTDKFISVTNGTKNSFFVQSANANDFENLSFDTVVKLLPNSTRYIFYFDHFSMLCQNVSIFHDIRMLQRMCSIQMSFAKGFGSEYTKDVTSTPCWIQMHVRRAMTELDKILPQFQLPDAYNTNSK